MAGPRFAAAMAIYWVATAFTPSSAASAEKTEAARSLVRTVGDTIIELVSKPYLGGSLRKARFRTVYRSHFENLAIARWALGPAWRRATVEERRRFAGLLEDHVVKSLAANLVRYKPARLIVTDVTPKTSAIIVSSYLINSDPRSSRSTEVVWRLSGALKVYDVVIDKISLAMVLRRGVSAMMRQGGGTLDGLIGVLRRHVREFRSTAIRSAP